MNPKRSRVDRTPALLVLFALRGFRVFLATASLFSALTITFVRAQSGDEGKKNRAPSTKTHREAHATASPTPAETPEPTPKPKPGKSRNSTPKPRATATLTPKKTPAPRPAESPGPRTKAKSGTKESGEEETEATPKAEPTAPAKMSESSAATATPSIKKSPTPKPTESPAPTSKAKSGKNKPAEKGKTTTSTSKRKKKAASKKSSRQTKKPEGKRTPTPEENRKPDTRHGEPSAGNRKSEGGDSNEKEEAAESRPKSSSKKGVAPEPDKSPTPKSGLKTETETKKETTPKRVEGVEPAKTPPIEKPPKSVTEPSRIPAPEPPSQPRSFSTPPSPQAVLPSDITIEKSGLEQEQGLEPPPPPPPRRGFWPWSRQPANYNYLTSATIDAIRNAPVQRGRWKYVIVHNSGTRQGNARAFDYYHRKIRRMRNGLAYHFVIGNGTSSRNGQIEIGDRWRRQINGGHVHSDYMNNIGLGICLVGDFNRDQPTRAQLEACDELIKYLQERCGKSDGRSLIVRPHREVNPPRWATDCPGDAFPYNWFGRFK